MEEEFKKYVHNYDLNDLSIKRKFNHSIRVMKLSEKYAKKLGFSKYDTKLASLIGLFHDIGRFEQHTKYNTFNDFISFDHASYGVEILFKQGIIKNVWPNEEDYEVIEFAIENHNKYEIAKSPNKRALKHAQLIRDMDKLDIINIFGNTNEKEIEVCDDNISKDVMLQFLRHESVLYNLQKNVNDQIVLFFSFVFDIYHDECLYELKQRYKDYYQKLKKLSNKFDDVYKEVMEYIDERMDNYVREKI